MGPVHQLIGLGGAVGWVVLGSWPSFPISCSQNRGGGSRA